MIYYWSDSIFDWGYDEYTIIFGNGQISFLFDGHIRFDEQTGNFLSVEKGRPWVRL